MSFGGESFQKSTIFSLQRDTLSKICCSTEASTRQFKNLTRLPVSTGSFIRSIRTTELRDSGDAFFRTGARVSLRSHACICHLGSPGSSVHRSIISQKNAVILWGCLRTCLYRRVKITTMTRNVLHAGQQTDHQIIQVSYFNFFPRRLRIGIVGQSHNLLMTAWCKQIRIAKASLV